FGLMFISPLRVWFLRIFGAKIGKDTIIERVRFFNLYRKGLSGLNINDNCFLSDGVTLDLADAIKLEKETTLSVDALVLTHTNVGYPDHPLQQFIPSMTKPVIFKQGSFVGARAIILPGIMTGRFSVVAAGSLVNSNVPALTLVAGVPAKKIKTFKKKSK
ncbi:hypothetical protein ISS85_04380, partial [Candidatus Microgenomates bacterium]|nr:hypothetical protein [Candidatus Microgenomates bacterium]